MPVHADRPDPPCPAEPAPAREALPLSCTAFAGSTRIATGDLASVVRAALSARQDVASAPVLVFVDRDARIVDIDEQGCPHGDGLAPGRTAASGQPDRALAAPAPRRPGRPRLGVVAREVTLLPRHWEWLAGQPGGASVALRRLVETARRAGAGADRRRLAREATYRFMAAVAGDAPGFEEACRALFAGDEDGFRRFVAAWPADVARYACERAADAFT